MHGTHGLIILTSAALEGGKELDHLPNIVNHFHIASITFFPLKANDAGLPHGLAPPLL